jgi:uncharacterized integral membrane protein
MLGPSPTWRFVLVTLVPRRLRRHDPFWDLDGASARRARTQRRFVRIGVWAVIALLLGVVAVNVPTVDPEVLMNGAGRPVLIGSLLALLGACVLAGLARLRHPEA